MLVRKLTAPTPDAREFRHRYRGICQLDMTCLGPAIDCSTTPRLALEIGRLGSLRKIMRRRAALPSPVGLVYSGRFII